MLPFNKPVKAGLIPLFLLLLPVLAWLSISMGSYAMSWRQIWDALGTQSQTDQVWLVLSQIRMPRTLAALAAGAALATCGGAMQGLFRNQLVEPSLTGVSAGAALGAVLVIVFSNRLQLPVDNAMVAWLLPAAAFAGALLVSLLSYRLARLASGLYTVRLLLTGVAVNALAGALIGLAIFSANDAAIRNFTFWSLGSLSAVTWPKLAVAGPVMSLAILLLFRLRKGLNALTLGEAEAGHLGVDVHRLRLHIVVATALGVGATVAICGIVAFVGLVVPHVARLITGHDHNRLLPLAVLVGACLMLAADLLARLLFMPMELPIGIVTSLIGAPFFLYLLLTSRS